MPHLFTERTHMAGGVLLMAAGVVGVLVGVGSLAATITPGVLLPGVPFGVAAVGGGTIVVIAVIEFVGGLAAYRGRNWYGSLTAGVLGFVTLVTLPLDLIGVLLIALGEGQFEGAVVEGGEPRAPRGGSTSPETDAADGESVDPEVVVEGTIPEVQDRIEQSQEAIDIEAVIEAERAGKNRVTLLDWLERQQE